MTISHRKDVVLFRFTTIEMRQIMEEHSMIYSVWLNLQADMQEATQTERWIPHQCPLKVCHEERGRGHVLQCHVYLWRYFKELEGANPLEREIRSEMITLGLSGEADRRTSRHAP
jgi:hypothetical protein